MQFSFKARLGKVSHFKSACKGALTHSHFMHTAEVVRIQLISWILIQFGDVTFGKFEVLRHMMLSYPIPDKIC